MEKNENSLNDKNKMSYIMNDGTFKEDGKPI